MLVTPAKFVAPLMFVFSFLAPPSASSISSKDRKKTFHIGVAGNFLRSSKTTNNQWRIIYPTAELALRRYKSILDQAGIKIALKKLDYGNTLSGVVKTAKQAKHEKLDIVIGYSQSNHALVAAKILQEAGIPMITHTATRDDITSDRDHVFRVCVTNGMAIDQFAGYILSETDISHVISIHDDSCSYCLDLEDNFRKIFQTSGRNFDSYSSRSVKQAIAQKSEVETNTSSKVAILIPNHEQESALIARKILAHDPNAFLIGGDGWGNKGKVFFKIIRKRSFKGLNFTHWTLENLNRHYQDANIIRYLNAHPVDSAALMYDATAIAIEAILRHIRKPIEIGTIQRALEATNFHGITGKVKFDSNGDPNKKIFIQAIKNGSFVLQTREGLP